MSWQIRKNRNNPFRASLNTSLSQLLNVAQGNEDDWEDQ